MAKKKNKKKLNSFVHKSLSNASKTLLANIRFTSIDDRMKTIVVTSSEPNEGKTIVATNLANAIATSGKRVLIVDCDMRNRCLYKLLDLHPQHGVYAVLSDQVSAQEAIVPTRIDNLYFLDSEPGIPSPPDLLSTTQFESMVETLRGMFDYVIFDTPPVSLFVDAAIISSVVDGTLLVLRQRQTKRALAVETLQQLRTANAHILGTVMTFCSADEHDYYYAYYSQDGRRVDKKEIAANKPTFEPLRETEPKRTRQNAPSGGRHGAMPKQAAQENAANTASRVQATERRERPKQPQQSTQSAFKPVAGAKINPYAPQSFRTGKQTNNPRFSGKNTGR